MALPLLRSSRFITTLVAAALFLGPTSATGQSSAYVPSGDPAYRDLDALVAAGLVRNDIFGTRPYTEATFARAVAQAKTRLSPGSSNSDAGKAAASPASAKRRILEAVARLQSRFPGDSGRVIRGARMDVASADSPVRAVQSRSWFDKIDADVAPLTQRNGGREIPDGSSIAGEAWGDIRLGEHFVAALQPRIWLASPRDGGSSAGAEIVTGYARGLFGNLAIDVGRNSLSRGASREMNPLLSANARGLDMIRVSTDRPTRLPWFFRHLGPAVLGGSLATLGDNRDNPGGILVQWDASVRPASNLELGLTLVGQQAGEGAPSATVGQRILEGLFIARRALPLTHFLWADPLIGDKFFGADARLTLPGIGMDAYVAFGTSDDDDLFVARPTKSLWNEAAWLGGLRWHALGDEGRLDLWGEAAHNGVHVFTHAVFSSGLTLDRRVLGSPLGPLAAALQGGADWTATAGRLSVAGAWERYSGDLFAADTGAYGYIRIADGPDEVRLRATVDWVREPKRSGRVGTSVRAGYERVTRFNFTTVSRTNFMVQAGARWVW